MAKKQQDEATLANNRLDFGALHEAGAHRAAASSRSTPRGPGRASRRRGPRRPGADRHGEDQPELHHHHGADRRPHRPPPGRPGQHRPYVDTTPIATVVPQLQPISVVFTPPQQPPPAVAAAMGEGHALGAGPVPGSGHGGRGCSTAASSPVLDNQVDAATGTIKLKADLPERRVESWPGGFVNVRLLVDTQRRRRTTVPAAAVQRGPRGTFVFVVNADNTVKRQPVKRRPRGRDTPPSSPPASTPATRSSPTAPNA